MKKLFLILILLMASLINFSQDAYLKPSYGSIWGTVNDTLVESDTMSYVFRVKSNTVLDMNFGLDVTKVSGTVTNKFYFYPSYDGTAFLGAIDSITNTDAATGFNLDDVDLDDFNYPFIKVEGISPATAQKASYLLWYIVREE